MQKVLYRSTICGYKFSLFAFAFLVVVKLISMSAVDSIGGSGFGSFACPLFVYSCLSLWRETLDSVIGLQIRMTSLYEKLPYALDELFNHSLNISKRPLVPSL
jgi:hypothetical protein